MDREGNCPGRFEAPDRPSALRSLSGKGLQPFKVTESAAPAGKSKAKAAPSTKASSKPGQEVVSTDPIRLGGGQIQLFTEELSELLEAGMRLEPALKLMEGKGMTNPAAYRLVARRVGNLVPGRAIPPVCGHSAWPRLPSASRSAAWRRRVKRAVRSPRR